MLLIGTGEPYWFMITSLTYFRREANMKRIILIIISILLMSTVAYSAPFLVCDPQTDVTLYKLTGPAWVPVSVPAQPDGSIRMDVAAAIVGSTSLTVAACKDDVVWGELCSPFVPFSFVRPSAAAPPANIRLQ